MPITPFMGVRISCDIFAKNLSFTFNERSASSLALTMSCWYFFRLVISRPIPETSSILSLFLMGFKKTSTHFSSPSVVSNCTSKCCWLPLNASLYLLSKTFLSVRETILKPTFSVLKANWGFIPNWFSISCEYSWLKEVKDILRFTDHIKCELPSIIAVNRAVSRASKSSACLRAMARATCPEMKSNNSKSRCSYLFWRS